jgi:hypothetical protein
MAGRSQAGEREKSHTGKTEPAANRRAKKSGFGERLGRLVLALW